MNLIFYRILLSLTIIGFMAVLIVILPYPTLISFIIITLFMMTGSLDHFSGKPEDLNLVWLKKLCFPFALVYRYINLFLLRTAGMPEAIVRKERLLLKSTQRFPYDVRCAKERDYLIWLSGKYGWEYCDTFLNRENYIINSHLYYCLNYETFKKLGMKMYLVFYRGIEYFDPEYLRKELMYKGNNGDEYYRIVVICPDDVYESVKRTEGVEGKFYIVTLREVESLIETLSYRDFVAQSLLSPR